MKRRCGTVKVAARKTADFAGGVAEMVRIDSEAEALARAFRDFTLPKAGWTHRAHWTVALVFLLTEDEPGPAIASAIARYNEATGTPNTDRGGFHATITEASMRVAGMALGTLPRETTVSAAVERLMASRFGTMAWLAEHYSDGLLWSVEARRAWREPNLAPLTVTSLILR